MQADGEGDAAPADEVRHKTKNKRKNETENNQAMVVAEDGEQGDAAAEDEVRNKTKKETKQKRR